MSCWGCGDPIEEGMEGGVVQDEKGVYHPICFNCDEELKIMLNDLMEVGS